MFQLFILNSGTKLVPLQSSGLIFLRVLGKRHQCLEMKAENRCHDDLNPWVELTLEKPLCKGRVSKS